MSILRKIPIPLKSRALRLVTRRRVALPDGLMCLWFDFPSRGLRQALRKEGIGAIPLEHPGWEAMDNRHSLSPAAMESLLRYPVCIELEATQSELKELPPAVVDPVKQRHTRELEGFAAKIERALDVSKPGALAIIQGYESMNAVAREIALLRQIPVIAFENTALKDRILWDDHSAITTNRNLARNFHWRYVDTADSAESVRYCERLISETKQRKLSEHESPSVKYESAASKRPTLLFLGQVYTDSSVLFGIGGWKTPVALIRELAELAVRLDFNLWIKLHPKEISGVTPVTGQPYQKLTHRKLMQDAGFRELAGDSDRIMIDHENRFDTYDLMTKADVAITLNSQAGLEAAIRGLPTIVAGQAFYGGLGFTLEADCPQVLKVQVERALGMDEPARADFCQAARVFTHLYFERYCIEKTPAAMARLIAKRCFGRRGN